MNVKERPTEAKKYTLNETGKHLFTLLLRRRVEEALATCNYPVRFLLLWVLHLLYSTVLFNQADRHK